MNESRDLILKDMEKAKVLNAFFTLSFTGKTSLQQSQVSETSARVHGQVNLPVVEEDQVREYLNKPDTHKSLGLAGMHLQVLMACVNYL